MELSKIKSITDNNIDRIKKENLYRGFQIDDSDISIQCMDKNFNIRFDFIEEVAEITNWDNPYKNRIIPIEFMAPKRMFASLKSYC